MSNKSRLQANNENLQSLIDKANQLPNAGGSGSARQTFTLKIVFHESYFDFLNEYGEDGRLPQCFVYYTRLGEDGNSVLSKIDDADAIIDSNIKFKIIEDVLCDSLFMVEDELYQDPVVTNDSSIGLDPGWHQVGWRSSGDIFGHLVRPCAANTTVIFTFYSPNYDPSSE